MKTTYITDVASFLPNEPVSNDATEEILGMINGRPSRSRNIILRNNGIKSRHYAIDRKTGRYTHNNASLTAEAVRTLLDKSGTRPVEVGCLCCGTSSPDQIKPGHGSMVHGELTWPPCEVMSAAGVCASGMTAMKYAHMSVAAGFAMKAVCTGSEFISSFMRASNFEPEIQARIEALEKKPVLGFEKDFLRWMLSDGAGAALIAPQPNHDRISLRIDWIDIRSFAGDLPVCMYTGAVKRGDGSLQGWREAANPEDVLRRSYFAIKQDARILDEYIVSVAVERALLPMAKQYGLTPDMVTWYLPHYSSEYFRGPLHDMMKSRGFYVPYERWFTNLLEKGNTGAASIYIILEEMISSGKLKKGDTLLCMVPESGRFTICYAHMTVV
ncbi:MAG: beta-ketoacyl-ACP synthase III [Deltaproteobacteria bacterium]|nr:beta-ketoacyl-ACP synthase III [Deltaproteobacteria bacterium]